MSRLDAGLGPARGAAERRTLGTDTSMHEIRAVSRVRSFVTFELFGREVRGAAPVDIPRAAIHSNSRRQCRFSRGGSFNFPCNLTKTSVAKMSSRLFAILLLIGPPTGEHHGKERQVVTQGFCQTYRRRRARCRCVRSLLSFPRTRAGSAEDAEGPAMEPLRSGV